MVHSPILGNVEHMTEKREPGKPYHNGLNLSSLYASWQDGLKGCVTFVEDKKDGHFSWLPFRRDHNHSARLVFRIDVPPFFYLRHRPYGLRLEESEVDDGTTNPDGKGAPLSACCSASGIAVS